MNIAQSCVSSGTYLTPQFPSHGLGEPVAYGFQTLAKVAAVKIKHANHYTIDLGCLIKNKRMEWALIRTGGLIRYQL